VTQNSQCIFGLYTDLNDFLRARSLAINRTSVRFREIMKLLHHYIKLRPDYDEVLKESKFDAIQDKPSI